MVIKKYLISLLFFVLLSIFQVYFKPSLVLAPFPNFLLIFLVYSLFSFSPFYVLFLSFLSAIILDSLGGIFWGMNFLLFSFALGLGILAVKFFEKSHFLSRLIIGQLVIFSYFFGVFIINFLFKKPDLFFNVFLGFIITSFLYALLCLLTKNKKGNGKKSLY